METSNEGFYSANSLTPFKSVHPGEILGEELKARGVSQKLFADKIGIQASHLSALIHGSRSITPAVASKLESGLEGISADTWIRLQQEYTVNVQRSKVNTSILVSGYGLNRAVEPIPSLAEPKVPYGSQKVSLTIPKTDLKILEDLSHRLGWTIND